MVVVLGLDEPALGGDLLDPRQALGVALLHHAPVDLPDAGLAVGLVLVVEARQLGALGEPGTGRGESESESETRENEAS